METFYHFCCKSKGKKKVLILPMRNGNKGNALATALPDNRSYPTYEEWKQLSAHCKTFSTNSSYPTYEEWKQL